MTGMDERLATVAGVLGGHLSERDYEQGCVLSCGYDGDDRDDHLARALAPLLAEWQAEDEARALRGALLGITTHNGTPVTPENLRWAATHEALSRSYIFDVLTGLAAALDGAQS